MASWVGINPGSATWLASWQTTIIPVSDIGVSLPLSCFSRSSFQNSSILSGVYVKFLLLHLLFSSVLSRFCFTCRYPNSLYIQVILFLLFSPWDIVILKVSLDPDYPPVLLSCVLEKVAFRFEWEFLRSVLIATRNSGLSPSPLLPPGLT